MKAKLDVVVVPAELAEKELNGQTLVLIDVLRATTTITTALAHGCTAVYPTLTPEEARALAATHANALLGGERQGKKIPGFHLGNSPREYTPEVVAGKNIIFTTTNGTYVLRSAVTLGASRILLASFLNAPTLCHYLEQSSGDILCVCAGRNQQFSLEDTVLAGLLLDHLAKTNCCQLTDAAQMARLLYQNYAPDLLLMLKTSMHGRYLEEIGMGADLPVAATVGALTTIPEFNNGRIIALG